MNKEGKILYLVRHAKSSWSDAALTDRERPLNERGNRTAPDMGRRMLEQGHRPELIISSPADRAITTAKLIATELGYKVADIVSHENLYFSGTGGMIKIVEGLDIRYQKVMIVGHNPAMTSLLNILCDTSIVNMPTCAVAVIGFDMLSWAELDSTEGELLAYDYPKGPGFSSF